MQQYEIYGVISFKFCICNKLPYGHNTECN